VSVSDLYSPRIDLHISSSRTGRPFVEIYKSPTDAWMWKLELRPRYSFSGNICFEISVFCLCSAVSVYVSHSVSGTIFRISNNVQLALSGSKRSNRVSKEGYSRIFKLISQKKIISA
jgi:hypothetical protein